MAQDEDIADMFRPPLARGMQALDRSFFHKIVNLKAARIFENKSIASVRSQLERSRDSLQQERLGSIYSDPDPERAKAGKKCVLLRPEAQHNTEANGASESDNHQHTNGASAQSKSWPHSSTLSSLIEQGLISVIPYNLHLDYPYWTYHDIISSILPQDAQTEIPSGFSQVGHVAHLNLRDEYLPYKHLIATILLDKNPTVRTVINKIDDVGEENEFRTFRYEVLAGPDDLNVTVSEENCTFNFDYSKVYWNTRLNTEHRRLVSLFKEGEAVCDLMAGIGPFAVPAGKKNVFVWANDLNPESYTALIDAIKTNKVSDFVKPFNDDGRVFVRTAAEHLLDSDYSVEIKRKVSRKEANAKPEILRLITQPKTFQHFVLNLPASAVTFLSSFVGLYTSGMRQRLPEGTKMPIIHVYCFSTKNELQEEESEETSRSESTNCVATTTAEDKICAEISRQLQHPGMRPGSIDDHGGVEVYDVRDVAPKKRMFCASFRLPEAVAFRDR